MNKSPGKCAVTVSARDLRCGVTMVGAGRGGLLMRVLAVSVCGDGSLRVTTNVSEQRMTGSVRVRVLQ